MIIMFNKKRGQVVILSLSVILFMFLLVLVFFFESLSLTPVMADSKMRLLEGEATRLSDSILLPGFPENWNESDVQKVGLTSSDVLNMTKINILSAMTYTVAKFRLGVQFDFFINISYVNGTGVKKTILINDTGVDNIIGDDGKDFVITRQRASLIRDGGEVFPASVFVMVYAD